jgi:kumamolisin
MSRKLSSYFSLHPHASAATSTRFISKNIATIYGFPTPPTTPVVIGVISLGGGLYGTVTNGVLTNGDVQKYWTSGGITSQPRVIIKSVDGALNSPASDLNSTIENTIDVETVGACCPGSNVTIIFYIAPNTYNGFYNAFSSAIKTPVVVGGVSIKPSVISCSWGSPEAYFSNSDLSRYNTLFYQATLAGITICAASGDNGSSDGLAGKNVDFPASSPNVVACGGTSLVCPNLTYDSQTRETTWTGSGGGISKYFASPTYQTNNRSAGRSVPDIAMNADPKTGVTYLVNNTSYIVGGTSIVAPAVAALIAAGGYVGFPAKLYTLKSAAFHDITSGNNGDYTAGAGYDLCTGLGSPAGPEIKTELTSWVSVTGITLTPSTATVAIGASLQLTANVSPSGATNKTVAWKSSNTLIATVSSAGLVRRLKAGVATITATTNDGWFSASVPI